MTTMFRYETVFDAPSRDYVLAAYFDDDHLAVQDKAAALEDRKVIESHEDEAVRKATWSVRSQRPLPLFVRPFVEGGRLSYLEKMTWRKADGEIDLEIVPQILGGRVQIKAVYQLTDLEPGKVKRRYQGSITVNVKLLSKKIENAIAAEIDKGMPMMTDCTANWLRSKAR